MSSLRAGYGGAQGPQENETLPEVELKNNGNETRKVSLSETISEASTLSLIKRGTALQAIRGLISEYSNNTSIHGIKYFGARNQPWIDRIFWLFVIGLSMYACVSLTITTYSRWNNNPVIVSLAESTTPVWSIPFPTVTICPLVKSKRDVFDFGSYLQVYSDAGPDDDLNAEELFKFEVLSHVCLLNSYVLKELREFSEDVSNGTLRETLRELAPQLGEVFEEVKWRKSDLNATLVIKDVLTDDGLCFSFNSLDENDIYRNYSSNGNGNIRGKVWSLENGYLPEAGIDAYPRRVLAGDVDEGFYLMLKSRYSDSDPDCSGKSQGFKVILHTPGEFPQVSKRFFRVPYKQIVLVSIKPNMITTSSKVRTYDPEKKQCFFTSERYLKYFKIYTQGNCEHECLTNATLEKCECVKFSMPKDDGTPYCGAGKIKCYLDVRKNILRNDGFKKDCNCLPECTAIVYDAEVTQSVFNLTGIDFGQFEDLENDTDIARSTMNVFFGNNHFLSSKRSELYGVADLIANIGGLFGLFMGVSILSLVEILYFCTIRLGTNISMRQKAKIKYDN